jgi:carbon monoxide dehydrogenase subunit G
MDVHNEFEVNQPRELVWDLLMDVPQVVPCVPGATLVETLGDERWKAELLVKLGPVAMTFDADITRQEADVAAGNVRLAVRARERSGRGAANAEIHSALTPAGAGTRVSITTSLRLQGAVARVGRSDIVEDVSQHMVDAFAGCLRGKLTGELGADHAVAPQPTVRLVLKSLWARLRGVFRRR